MVGMLFSIPVANMKLTIGPSPHGGVADPRAISSRMESSDDSEIAVKSQIDRSIAIDLERARALKVASARAEWDFATTRRRPSYLPMIEQYGVLAWRESEGGGRQLL